VRNYLKRVGRFKQRPIQRKETPEDIGANSEEKSERVFAPYSHHLSVVNKLDSKLKLTVLNLLDSFLQIIAAL